MRTQRRTLAALLAAVVTAVMLTACSDQPDPLIVGHDGTPEMRTAAAVYAGALARTGLDVETEVDAQPDLLDAVASGTLGLYPAFTGDLLRELTPNPTALTSADVLADVNRSLPQQVSVGDPAAVSNRWQVLARTADLEHHGVTDLSECGKYLIADHALIVTAPPPADVLAALTPCAIGNIVTVASTDDVVARVRQGSAFGLITALDAATLTQLSGVQAIPSQGAPIAEDLVPVFASGALGKSQLKALSRVAGELTTTDLAQLVREVRGGESPRVVAGRWLATRGV